LAYLLQCELALEASQALAREQVERRLPTFARASQNMAAVAMLLDALPAPSTNGAGEVYQRLKSIIGGTVAQQAESSLLHQVEASILLPTDPKDGGQRATQGAHEDLCSFFLLRCRVRLQLGCGGGKSEEQGVVMPHDWWCSRGLWGC
jgi:hypothetical protein